MTPSELLTAEIFYGLCRNDLLEILLQMKTPANKELFIEIAARLEHAKSVRVQTQFAETKEIPH